MAETAPSIPWLGGGDTMGACVHSLTELNQPHRLDL